jgi:hypothetical protein
MKQFQKGDCFRIPWDVDFGEVIFEVYEIMPEQSGKQLLYACDINDEETVIEIYNEEVLPA